MEPTKEKVIGIWTVTSDLENLYHIEELTMYISYHSHRRLYVDHITLLHQKLFCLGTYCFDDRVGEQLFLVQACNTLVEVDTG